MQKHIYKIVKLLITIYILLTLAQITALLLNGVNLFESICYSFGTVSTGNFYPNNTGLHNSTPIIQYILIIFMFLSVINYLFYLSFLIRKTKKHHFFEEIKVYGITILIVIIWLFVIRYHNSTQQIWTIFRETTFQVLSFFSTSGYSTSNYLLWPPYIIMIFVLLLFIGGCANSPSGGIKFSRFIIMLKNLRYTFKMNGSCSDNYEIKYDRKKVDEELNLSILTFITVFGMVFMLGTLFLTMLNINFKNAAFLSISALSTFGNIHHIANFPEASKIILASLMLIGRLEIYSLILIFTPSINKKINHQ
ncbi:MAG: TrkH family potassium uptake protein [Bacteroidales bacterium]